jgi:hypothetical protein
VDTPVIGGCFNPEFLTWSNGLIDHFRAGRFSFVLSDVLRGKSHTEIIAFFKKAADETREEINLRRTTDLHSESCG